MSCEFRSCLSPPCLTLVAKCRLMNCLPDQQSTPFLDESSEYVACRLFFLQGLLNWLGAIGLGLVRDDKDSKSLASTKAFKSSIGSCIFGIMVMIIAFYNHHLTFYNNYLHMVWRFFYLAFKRYYVNWPPRSLPFVALLPFGYAVRRLYAAFAQPSSITAAEARKSQGVV